MIHILSAVNLNKRLAADLDALLSACASAGQAAFIETDVGLNVHRGMKSLYLAFEDDRLIGALSLFAPLRSEAEVNALTLPEARKRGVFRALLTEAELELKRFCYQEELFVVESTSSAGKAAAARLGARYEYTEYEMRYMGHAPPLPDLGLRVAPVGPERFEELVALRAGEFDDSREEREAFERATLEAPDRREYAAFLGDRLIGACTFSFKGAEASINGLVVDEDVRGKGYGQAFLSRILALLSGQRFEIVLDVDSGNVNALHIYQKLGFVRKKAVEYHRRACPWI